MIIELKEMIAQAVSKAQESIKVEMRKLPQLEMIEMKTIVGDIKKKNNQEKLWRAE